MRADKIYKDLVLSVLNWPDSLGPFSKYQQNQFDIPITGPVECVTTAVVTARNMLNDYLAFLTSRSALPKLKLREYIDGLDGLGVRGWRYRFPTTFPELRIPRTAIRLSPRGFMLPRTQAPRALRMIAEDFQRYYGCSFRIRQTSNGTIPEIADHLRLGHLVLVSGMNEPAGPEQKFLGGSPHTFGPVTRIDFKQQQISLIDTGASPITRLTFDSFMMFWGRKSRLDLYTRRNTMTVLIPNRSFTSSQDDPDLIFMA